MVDFDLLNDISHKTSMLDVLDYYGIEYQNSSADRCKAVCPFHDDHSPSLIIYINNEHDKESFCCYVDNTAGANTVTIAVAVDGVLSALAAANAASFGLLTIPSGVTGTAEFTIMFSSATAYKFSRTA